MADTVWTTGTAVRRLLVVVAALAILAPLGPAAYAHATLVSTSPKDGTTIQNEPGKVSFTFNQNIRTPAYVVVTAPDGTHVQTGEVKVVDETVTQGLEHAGIAGEYTASYRVVSADGHPVEGTISYTVKSGRTVIAEESQSQSRNSQQDSFLQQNRTYLIGGLAAAIVAAALLLWPRRRDHA